MDAELRAPMPYAPRDARPPKYSQPGVGLSIWLVRFLGLVLLLLLAVGVSRYPGGPILAAASLILYAGLLWYRPESWMFVVPAVLPVLDFAPWTGWVYFDELDFVLAVTVVVAAWRLPNGEKAALAPGMGVLFGLLSLVWFLSLLVGVLPLEPFDKSLLSNYYTKYNALRVAKGFFWMVLLWPLVRRSVGTDLSHLERWFFPGMLAGLLALGMVVLWERATFVGLADFSSPHRITALFSSMHVGGGAIDGYLALSVPFSWWLISRFDSPWRSFFGLGVFALGAYTIVVTFSRGLYAGFAASLLILALAQFGSAARERTLGLGRFIFGGLLIVVLAITFTRVFAAGGYRALGAGLVTLGVGYILGARPVALKDLLGSVVAGALLSLLSLALVRWMDKGAYVAFALSALTAGAGLALQFLGGKQKGSERVVAIGFVWCLINSTFVAMHWGGSAARGASVVASMVMFCALLLNLGSKQAIWTTSARSGATAAILAMIFLVGMPIVGRSYFIGQRVSAGSSDMDRRLQHWREAWQLQRNDVLSQLFGIGLGRFPAAYYAQNPHGMRPGAMYYSHEAGNAYARLIGPSVDSATPIYFGQHVQVDSNQVYQISMRARSNSNHATRVSVGFCRVVVLFTDACAWWNVEVVPGGWRTYAQTLASADMGRQELVGRKPVRLVIVNSAPQIVIDVDDVALSRSALEAPPLGNPHRAVNLLRNSDFAQAPDYWFYSVNDFWPWHVENTWLLVLLETGWIGLICFLSVLIFSVLRLLGRSIRGSPHSAIWLAAMGGFLVVATVNSQFEFPRVTLMFFLVMLCALMRRPAEPLVDAVVRRAQTAPRAFIRTEH